MSAERDTGGGENGSVAEIPLNFVPDELNQGAVEVRRRSERIIEALALLHLKVKHEHAHAHENQNETQNEHENEHES